MSLKPEPESTSHGSSHGYKVEAKLLDDAVMSGPLDLGGGLILDHEWRTVPTTHAPELSGIVVPNNIHPAWLATENGLMTYEAAMSIGWHLLAGARSAWKIEFRLRRYDVSYSHSVKRGDGGEAVSHSWAHELKQMKKGTVSGD